MAVQKEIVSTSNAPAAVGPYSQAVKVGEFVFTAGQIPLDPASGKIVTGGIEAETQRSMQNLSAVLTAAGTGLENVVKTTIFVTDIADFAKVNQVYGSFFGGNPPARSTVQVAALPLGAHVEIEAVAVLP